MFRLILKDLLLQKKMVIWSLVYIIFFSFTFQGAGEVAVVPIIVAISYMLLMTGCAWEDKNNSDVLLNSLPISRTKIVAAKYLSVFVYALVVLPAYWLITSLLMPLNNVTGLTIYPLNLMGVIVGFATVALLSAFYLPVFFKVGYMRSRIINFALFFAVFALGSMSAKYLMKLPKPDWVDSLPDLTRYSDMTILWLILLVALLIQLASYAFALKFYKQREF